MRKTFTVILAILLMFSYNTVASDRPVIDVNNSLRTLFDTIHDMEMSSQPEAFCSQILARYLLLSRYSKAPALTINVVTKVKDDSEWASKDVVTTYAWKDYQSREYIFTIKDLAIEDSVIEGWLEFKSKKLEPEMDRAFAMYYSFHGSFPDDLSVFFKTFELGVHIDRETRLFPYVEFSNVLQYYIMGRTDGLFSNDNEFTHKIRVFTSY